MREGSWRMHESEDEREPEMPGRESEMETEEVEILDIEGQPDGDYLRPPPVEAAARPAPAVAGEDRDETEELRERYLRLRADFDNFRKRNEREREELLRYALTEPLRELLPVVDNLERALAAQATGEDLRRGVELIAKQLRETLRRFGLTPVAALGERFDPKLHEAVMREESTAVQAPTVVTELQRGYLLHDRLLRPAMVKVAMPPEAPRGQEPAEGTPADPGAAERPDEEGA